MKMHLSRLMALFAARTLRNGGEFDGPDLAEDEILDELAAELPGVKG
ncbi:MAG TPA: hypothetical protein PLT37_01460 [Kiritimatiellia bacterium]|jgi:hypothetical protein|nr:hypothetical protein [Kiritimatiellia bacterium]MBP9571488.1 hypothetical protein [Kiritimatiellia bacterium]HQF19893.1 hypothetical protein [Kiritimatiellia bacterium]HQG73819.1 hypothetical protein [Kiritimatiellia bacterium]HXK78573.1 hypothetical protein [Kiritimatiellia bacterium]